MACYRIRAAGEREFGSVQGFYWRLIDDMQSMPYLPGWERGIYPSDEFLLTALKAGELYVLEQNGRIAAAMVLNRECNDGYSEAKWQTQAAEDEVLVIHALGVLPELQGKGLAKAMVREAIRTAKAKKQKAIRLDVLGGNEPAVKLYEGLGFRFNCTVKMFYEDTGLTDFLLYELPL